MNTYSDALTESTYSLDNALFEGELKTLEASFASSEIIMNGNYFFAKLLNYFKSEKAYESAKAEHLESAINDCNRILKDLKDEKKRYQKGTSEFGTRARMQFSIFFRTQSELMFSTYKLAFPTMVGAGAMAIGVLLGAPAFIHWVTIDLGFAISYITALSFHLKTIRDTYYNVMDYERLLDNYIENVTKVRQSHMAELTKVRRKMRHHM